MERYVIFWRKNSTFYKSKEIIIDRENLLISHVVRIFHSSGMPKED